MIKVSIVIPTFNRCISVSRALAAITRQTFPRDEFEVIVSIDGSEDGTKEMVDVFKTDFSLRSIWDTNSGRAAACNKAILETIGDILIILDDDMEPSPDLIEAHYTAHQDNMKIGVIGAVPIIVDESSTPIVRYNGAKFNSHLKKISEPGYKIRVWDFYSGNFSISRGNMFEIGLFNEDFVIYGNEDVELAHRLLESGINIVYSPDAYCIQHYEKDFRGLAKDTIAAGKTAVLLYTKYPDTFKELKLIEYNFTGWKWRSLRLFLIWTSILIPATTNFLISIINLFERPDSRVHERLYHLAMDYFFWLGVWTALRNHKCKKEFISKIKSSKKPQRCPKP